MRSTVAEDQKLYGELGTLGYDPVEDKIECKLCGQWYIYLAPHLRWKHNLTVDEYREDFGLNRTQPLCTPTLSEKHRRHFIAQGLVGKHLVFNLGEFPHSTERRLQGRLNFTRARTGLPIRATEKSIQAARRRYQKNCVPQPCTVCGITVLARKIDGHAVLCDDCRPRHKKEYNRRWADAHRQRLREYWRDYDQNRRHRVKVEHN